MCYVACYVVGKVGRFVNSLVLDLRKVMEPFTAQKLKVSNSVLNTLIEQSGVIYVSFTSLALLQSLVVCVVIVQILKNNVLRDFIHVAGPYGVTHFLLLSRSEMSANLVCYSGITSLLLQCSL